MTGPGGFLPAKLAALLGSGKAAAVIIAAGLGMGVLVTPLLYRPASSKAEAAVQPLGVFACPDDVDPIATIPGGQRMLVTGRTADARWFQIYLGAIGQANGWVVADRVSLQAAGDAIPVVSCQVLIALNLTPGPTLTVAGTFDPTPEPPPLAPSDAPSGVPAVVTPVPTARPTAKTARPTAKPTARPTAKATARPTAKPTARPTARPKPTTKPTAKPTPVPDTTPPRFSWAEYDVATVACTSITFSTTVRDNAGGSGVKNVTLYSRVVGAPDLYKTWAMKKGTLGRWSLSLNGPTTFNPATYIWSMTAWDVAGNKVDYFDGSQFKSIGCPN